MVTEDDVDAESLQAQIDMTMSFAHDLVTSWIKPSQLPQLRSSGVDAQQILEEELRRPPRLGVGAVTPAISPLAHESSKLKRKLGKYGPKNEGVVEPKLQDSLKPDDEEHKGRPAKRNAKVDPFGHEGNKKKRKTDSKHDLKQLNPPDDAVEKPMIHNPPSNREMERDDRRSTILSFSEPSRKSSGPVPGRKITSGSSEVRNDSTSLPEKASPLSIPLLNLCGPPEVVNSPGKNTESNNPKKKRKRRKKKKTKVMTSTGDALDNT